MIPFVFRQNKFTVFCLGIIFFYLLITFFAKFGWIATPWNLEVGGRRSPPSSEAVALWFGTDLLGRSILYKAIQSTAFAMTVALVSTLVTIPFGFLLGAVAGYFGGWVDDVVVWIYTCISSIPNVLLIIAVAFVMGRGDASLVVALAATGWMGLARVIRAEFLRHRDLDYVTAAASVGANHFSRIFKHILPNVSYQIVIYFTIQFQVAVKFEVVLSYLGLGARNHPSWGIMIDDARGELMQGVWWQLVAATVFIFFLLLALNHVGDAIRDALDPRSQTKAQA